MHDLIPMPASSSLTAIDAEAILEPGVYSGDRRGEHAIRGDALG